MHNKRLELVELTDKELVQIDGGGWEEALARALELAEPYLDAIWDQIGEPIWDAVTDALGDRGPCGDLNEAGVDNYNSTMAGM